MNNNALIELIRQQGMPRRNVGFSGQEGEMLNMLAMQPEEQMQPMNTIRTSSGEYITPGGGRSMQPAEFGQAPQPPQMRGSPVDVFGQGKGFMQPDGTIIGTNAQGQQFKVQPSGTADAQQRARDAGMDRRLLMAKIGTEEAKTRGGMSAADQLAREKFEWLKSNKPAQALSATAQKELFEADEIAQAANNAVGMLKEALTLNDKAYSGFGAKERAVIRSNLPGESEAANATINLDNLMTGQALESLKAIFGATPTEGERKILLDLQASAEKTPVQRKMIIDRATQAALRRVKFNKEKAQLLRSGEYFSRPIEYADTSPSTQQPNNQDDEAVVWARSNPNDPRAARILSMHGM